MLLHRRTRQAQHLYAMQLSWLIGAQLFTLGGGQDYPVPDAFSLFADAAAPRDRRSAGDIRQGVLAHLNNRKEEHHGEAV